MHLNVTYAAVINAAGAFFFLAAGITMLAIGRRSRRGLLVGTFATTFGLTFVVENLLPYQTDALAAAIVGSAGVSVVLASGALAVHLARGAQRSGRRAVVWSAAVVAFAVATMAVVMATDSRAVATVAFGVVDQAGQITSGGQGLSFVASWLMHVVQLALLPLLAACGAAFQGTSDDRSRKALALLALSFGLFAVFINIANGLFSWTPALSAVDRWLWLASFGIRAMLAALVGLTFLPGRRASPSTPGLAPALGLMAAGALACLVTAVFPDGRDVGAYGILRMVGVVFLARAVLKHDLLGVPLPHLAAKRGVLATGALASLFIVAQVAQNFFAAQYGLIMGGIVAGTMVFAASPIQRAMEAKAHRQVAAAGQPAVASSVAAPSRREETYRRALRLALRDRTLTAEEESHLFELAEDLGIGAGRAFQLKKQVEAEVGA